MSSPDESCPTTRKPTKTLTPQYPSQSGWYDGKREEGWPFVSQVTCHRGVPRACHPSQSHACLAGGCMGLARRQWWPRYGRLHTAGAWWGASQGLSSARFTHGHWGIGGYAGGRGRTETRPREILGRKCGLGNYERAAAWQEERNTLVLGSAWQACSSHDQIFIVRFLIWFVNPADTFSHDISWPGTKVGNKRTASREETHT